MRKLVFLIAFAPISLAAQPNLCADSLYLALKQVPVDEMTDRQFEIFRERDRVCLRSANNLLNNVAEEAISYDLGRAIGKKDADSLNVVGSLVGGVAGGLIAGVIGGMVAYVAQDEPEIPEGKFIMLQDRDPSFALGYEDGYLERGLKRKRTMAVIGGTVGTAVSVAVILAQYRVEW